MPKKAFFQMKKFIKFFFDFLFPPRCLLCNKTEIYPMCGKCLSILPLTKHVVEYKSKSGLNGVFSASFYEGLMKTAISKFKYKHKAALSVPLGSLLSDFYKNNIQKRYSIDCIVPVPLFKNKQNNREFNQSYLLAKILEKYSKIPIKQNVLIKTRNTMPLYALHKNDRIKNIAGSFKAFNENNNYKNILLIDDIFTTGATGNECARVLKLTGVQKVYLLTLSIRKELF